MMGSNQMTRHWILIGFVLLSIAPAASGSEKTNTYGVAVTQVERLSSLAHIQGRCRFAIKVAGH